MSELALSVVVPTHNADQERLRRTLHGLRGQTLSAALWETVLVDNASTNFPNASFFAEHAPTNLRIVAEPQLGLTPARRCGITEARGAAIVLVDDDNVLTADYLAQVLVLFSTHPNVGVLGGKSMPEFAAPPPAWTREFHGLLAMRDLGENPLISRGLHPPGAAQACYPEFAPIGAGMVLRREAADAWLHALIHDPRRSTLDRRGTALSSGGDNDIVLTAMAAGWEVAYFPQLRLTHLIPAARLDHAYLARLNRAMQKSWMQVLTLHDANPWPPLSPAGAALRKVKAWFTYHPWTAAAARVRYAGACGHFEGRVTIQHIHVA